MEAEVKAPSAERSVSAVTPAESAPDEYCSVQPLGPLRPAVFPYQSLCESAYEEAAFESQVEFDEADLACDDGELSERETSGDDEMTGQDELLCDDYLEDAGIAPDAEREPVWNRVLNLLDVLAIAAQVNPLSRSGGGPSGVAGKGVGMTARASASIVDGNRRQRTTSRKPTGAAVSRFTAARQVKAVRKSQRLDINIGDVAKELGISLSTLDKWRARWLPWLAKREPGHWHTKPHSRSKHSKEAWEAFLQAWEQTPRRERAAAAQRFGVSPFTARAAYRRWKANAPRTAIPSWNLSWNEIVLHQQSSVMRKQP